MRKVFLKLFVELTGNKLMSKLLRNFTNSKWSKVLIPLYVKVYKINQDEMELPLSEYKSLKQLFTRLLKNGVRQIDSNEKVIVSPVDGVVSEFGAIKDVENLPIKKMNICFEELFGNDEVAAKYKNGKYMIIYLSPYHYHRIHSPIKGRIKGSWSLGGKSFPVNQLGLKYGKRPLSTNFRRITEIESSYKDVAVVKVGALNVNSIHLTYQDKQLNTGDEIAYFSFGSTVVLMVESAEFNFSKEVYNGKELKYGERILEI